MKNVVKKMSIGELFISKKGGRMTDTKKSGENLVIVYLPFFLVTLENSMGKGVHLLFHEIFMDITRNSFFTIVHLVPHP